MRIQRRHNTLVRASRPLRNHPVAPSSPTGSASLALVAVLAFAFAIGGYHLYSVNQSAVQGYHMRSVEKEIATLQKENADLRIEEADLRSLYRIEEAGERLQMQPAGEERYLETRGPVAMR